MLISLSFEFRFAIFGFSSSVPTGANTPLPVDDDASSCSRSPTSAPIFGGGPENRSLLSAPRFAGDGPPPSPTAASTFSIPSGPSSFAPTALGTSSLAPRSAACCCFARSSGWPDLTAAAVDHLNPCPAPLTLTAPPLLRRVVIQNSNASCTRIRVVSLHAHASSSPP